MNQHYENIHRYDFLTKEILEEEYIANGLSDAQIAEKFNMPSKAVVWRKRKKFGIANRYSAKSNRHASKNRKHKLTRNQALRFLKENKTYQEIANQMGCSIMVVKRRLKELGLTRSQDHAEKYKYWDVQLTDSQKQMIIGSVLGDGTIAKQGAYSCSHSNDQKDYLDHKRQVLRSMHSGKYQHAIHKAQSVKGKHFESYHFTTGCNKFCSMLRRTFYPAGKKIFPFMFLMKYMNAEALAYWYMDDGTACWDPRYKSNSSGAQILTLGYTYKEQELINRVLWEKFEIRTTLVYVKDKKSYVQVFRTTETSKLFALIRPYIIPSMLYKVDYQAYLDKETTPSSQ